MDIGCWIAWCPQHFAGSCSMFWGLRTSNLPPILSICWLVETDCLCAPEFSHHLVFMGEEHFSKGVSPSGRPLSLHGPAASLGESREEAVNWKPLQAFLPFTHLMVTDMLSCSSEARRTELLFLFFSLSLERWRKNHPIQRLGLELKQIIHWYVHGIVKRARINFFHLPTSVSQLRIGILLPILWELCDSEQLKTF